MLSITFILANNLILLQIHTKHPLHYQPKSLLVKISKEWYSKLEKHYIELPFSIISVVWLFGCYVADCADTLTFVSVEFCYLAAAIGHFLAILHRLEILVVLGRWPALLILGRFVLVLRWIDAEP